MHLVCKADDSIIAHDIVDALLIVQFELEMIFCFEVKINTSNSASVEGLARKRCHQLSGTPVRRSTSDAAHLRSMGKIF